MMPAVDGDLEPRREPLERIEGEEPDLAVVVARRAAELGTATCAQVGVRLQHEVEDTVVEGEDHDRTDHDRQRGPDDADAQLGQMLRERHRVVGCLGDGSCLTRAATGESCVVGLTAIS